MPDQAITRCAFRAASGSGFFGRHWWVSLPVDDAHTLHDLSSPAMRRRCAMSVEVRWDQCCETAGCTKPARYGALCFFCFQGATPARRAVEVAADPTSQPAAAADGGYVSDEGAAWLERLWAA
jgi:hypothetical protein